MRKVFLLATIILMGLVIYGQNGPSLEETKNYIAKRIIMPNDEVLKKIYFNSAGSKLTVETIDISDYFKHIIDITKCTITIIEVNSFEGLPLKNPMAKLMFKPSKAGLEMMESYYKDTPSDKFSEWNAPIKFTFMFEKNADPEKVLKAFHHLQKLLGVTNVTDEDLF